MTDVQKHLVCRGFEAAVVVHKEPLPQFGVDYNEQMGEASAYIPSKAGRRFKVQYRKLVEDGNSYHAALYLDGHLCSSRVHQNQIMEAKRMSCIEVSPIEFRYFIFNTAALTDDDEYLNDPSSAGVGEIKIVLQPVKALDQAPKPTTFTNVSNTGPTKIHEQSNKGLVHQIKLTESQPKPYTATESICIDRVGDPVTFIFKYRPLDVLQAKELAPRPTAPPGTEDDGTPQQEPSIAKFEEDEGDFKYPMLTEPDLPHSASGTVPLPMSPQALETQHDGCPRPQESVEKSAKEEEDSIPQLSLPDVKHEDEIIKEDEDDEIVIRERALMAELQEVRRRKRARMDTICRPTKKVKMESTCHFRPGEIIDLTAETNMMRLKKRKKRVKTEAMMHFACGEVIDLT